MISPFLDVFTYIHAENINRFHGSYEIYGKAVARKFFLFGENYSIGQKEKQERGSVKRCANN